MQLAEETYNKLKNIYPALDKDDFLLVWNYINDFEDFRNNSANKKLKTAIEISKISINEINLSSTTIIAVFLYVFTKNELFEKGKLESIFGKEVSEIVSGLLKIPVIQLDKLSIQTEKFINLLLTISTDVRSILIKLAEMLYCLRNLKNADRTEQIKTASEISVLYAPIAHRLGLYAIKTEMEDLSMKYLHPETYKDIAKKLEATKSSRNQYIEEFIAPLKKELKKQGIHCEIKGRPKSIYSIWNKMKKQGVEFDEVYDKFAIRVIIDTELPQEKAQCWQVYSIITDKYVPNPRRLRDWISAPKASGYESLHTTVIGPKEKWVEVQIRTRRMDEIAEKGQAAHWKYKENKAGQAKSDWLGKIREILEKPDKSFQQSTTEDKAKLYTDEIFVFTPNGDLKRLHRGYTVLDFAFSIHTNIGEKCTGAIVNGKIENIRHVLKNGDEVKVLTSKNQKPKYEWLEIVKSPRARAKIKRVIKAETYKDLDLGKEAVKQKLSQLKLDFNDIHINKLVVYFGFKTTLDFYQAIGEGKLDIHKIKKAFADISEKENETQIEEQTELRILNKKISKSKTQDYLIIEDNLQTIDYQLSKCCNPIPGDEIFGFITVSKGTKIHKKTCPNAKDMYARFPYRIVEAKWNTEHETGEFNVQIHINGKDKVGIVNTITEIIAKEFKLNLRALTIHPRKDNLFEGIIITSVNNTKQLNNLIERLKKIEDVYEVKRKVN
ncbi:MAG: RelA/SpoT family protein [Bacteroidales bacterium]|nr:RelA/SpoT family protein [Bacteroidales bacterium]